MWRRRRREEGGGVWRKDWNRGMGRKGEMDGLGWIRSLGCRGTFLRVFSVYVITQFFFSVLLKKFGELQRHCSKLFFLHSMPLSSY